MSKLLLQEGQRLERMGENGSRIFDLPGFNLQLPTQGIIHRPEGPKMWSYVDPFPQAGDLDHYCVSSSFSFG